MDQVPVFPLEGKLQVPPAEHPCRVPVKLIPSAEDPARLAVPVPEKGTGPNPGQATVPANPVPVWEIRNSQGSVLPAPGPEVTTTEPFHRPVQVLDAGAPDEDDGKSAQSISRHARRSL